MQIYLTQYNQTNFGCRLKSNTVKNAVKSIKIAEYVPQNTSKTFKQNLREYFVGYPKRIKYTARHKKAFLKMEKELTGKNSLSGYLHDLDKLFMYVIGVPKPLAHDIHVATAPHHFRNGKIKKPVQTVIDWECARFTKPDKPLNARDFYESYYVKKLNLRIPEIEELLDKFGL